MSCVFSLDNELQTMRSLAECTNISLDKLWVVHQLTKWPRPILLRKTGSLQEYYYMQIMREDIGDGPARIKYIFPRPVGVSSAKGLTLRNIGFVEFQSK